MLSSVPSEIQQHCEQVLGPLKSFRHASGGCINNGGLIVGAQGRAFVKWNSASRFPHMFRAEAKGLNLLRNNGLDIPNVIDAFEGKVNSCLLLEHIQSGHKQLSFWEELGHGLASIHKQTSSNYGLDHDNYIGSLQQLNTSNTDGIGFFIESRIKPQVELAVENNRIDKKDLDSFDLLYTKLPSLLINDPPALVHGDLWSGNFMIGAEGQPVLIDPAVCYSLREMDLAMTQLFGGFDQAFYDAYQESFPLASGFQDRFEILNLYPLMVHVNLFGGGYYQKVVNTLNKFL